ncbi:serine hydrolase domain-containing protein [Sphingomicrobium sp. XHP0235]|uniref:serine hydrolase domain-containing protein n=1 Tax=Sphingomicrobium aquimarinum TaxID=3133971 RepID=UPI0031FEF2DC
MRRSFLSCVSLLLASCTLTAAPDAPAGDGPATIASSVVATRSHDGTVRVTPAGALTSDTQFQAGSIAKWVCSVAVLRLVDRNKLALSDRIVDLLPGFEGPRDVRVRDLLANRAGLSDGLTAALEADGPAAVIALDLDAASAANRFAAGPAAAPRDTRFSYDLVNWILVQAILEREAGEPLDRLMQTELLGKSAADLSATRFSSGMPALADAPAIEGNVTIPAWLGCAGGMVTTPADLVRLMDWVATAALGPESRATLVRNTSPEEQYALGGRVRTRAGSPSLFWLSGSNGAFKSRAAYDPVSRRGFAAMTASDDYGPLEAAMEDWADTLQD